MAALFHQLAISLRLHAGQRDRIWALANAEGRSLNDMVCDLLDRGMMRGDEAFGSHQGFTIARALLAALKRPWPDMAPREACGCTTPASFNWRVQR